MNRKLLIESGPFEDRVALLEDGVLVEVEVERRRNRSLVGNVYLGKVSRWIEGLQAAFVDIGLRRNGYLFVDRPRPTGDRETEKVDGDEACRVEIERHSPAEARVGFEAGQEVLVQVTRDPVANKGPRVSREISLPGRCAVLLPFGSGVGISRQIDDPDERERLLESLEGRQASQGGVIVRTVGRGRPGSRIGAEIEELEALWLSIRETSARSAPPALIHAAADPGRRAVRDLLDDSVAEIVVQGDDCHEQLAVSIGLSDPELLERLHHDDGPESLFCKYGLESELEGLLRRKLWLASGGYIAIDSTEALIAVDVNTGRNLGTGRLEETALTTNLEAAVEIARQIRLRDLGGIIVIDFIDMLEPDNQQRVLNVLAEKLDKDRSKTQVSGMSEFGLVQMTRKRSKNTVESLFTAGCPCCGGRGRIRSARALAYQAAREALLSRDRLRGETVRLRCSPETAEVLRSLEPPVLEEIGDELEAKIEVEEDAQLGREEFELVVNR